MSYRIDTVNWTSIPATNAGYELLGISGADMIGELAEGEDPFNLPRIQGVGRRGGFEKYVLYFDEPGNVTFTINEVGSSEVYYFHTIVVRPDYNLTVNLSGTIPYGEEAIVGHNANPIQCQSANWFFWNGGSFDGKYNYEILEGGEYATLEREYFDEDLSEKVRESGQSFEGTEDNVYLYMNGFEPLDSAFVTVKISTTDPEVNTITQVVKVVPNDYYELGVAINPSELNSGDTADVILSRKVAGSDTASSGGYDYEAFPEDQIFNASIIKGTEYAYLYDPVEGTSDYELTDVEQGFKLIINPCVDTNNVEIKLKGSTTISDGTSSPLSAPAGNNHPVKVVNTTVTKHKFKQKVTSSGTNKTTFIGIPSGKEIFGIGKAIVDTSSKIDIMLGETKYFQAKQNNSTHKLKIEEISLNEGTDQPSFPTNAGEGWEWIKKDDVWGTDPVTIESGTKYGKKQGIYWEKKYPIYSGNKFQKMKDLDAGLIRIIGRYWHKDSTYVVKLKAVSGDNNTTIKLKVIKPKKIGVKKDALTDVKGNGYNLDELILKYAGLNGVPPQIIKGIIDKESSFSNGMRWEPFFEIDPNRSFIQVKDKNGNYIHNTMSKGRYRIKSSIDKGYPEIPSLSDHKNINNRKNAYPNKYWGFQGSIWDLFYKNCREFNPNAESDIYNSKISDWTSGLKEGWFKKFKDSKTEYEIGYVPAEKDTIVPEIPQSYSYAYALNEANNWAKNEYHKGIMSEIAQTRIATSYGLMQVLYTSATAYLHYPEEYYSDPTPQVPSHLPEYLNEKDISLKYGAKGIAFYVNKEIKYKNDNKDRNWTAGFEHTFEIGLYGFNHGSSKRRYKKNKYSSDVLKRAQKYLPSN